MAGLISCLFILLPMNDHTVYLALLLLPSLHLMHHDVWTQLQHMASTTVM